MASTNTVYQTIRLLGSTVEFGNLATRDYSVQTTVGEVKEITETIKDSDLDREFDFSNFENGEAIFFFIAVKNNPISLKINNPANQSFTIPAGGVMMLKGEGIQSVFISGAVSGNSNIFIQAAGDVVT
jgi:hypothetical protein